MDKLSAEQIHAVISAAPDMLRKLAAERDKLKEKVEELQKELDSYRLDERVTKLASKIRNKGLDQGRPLDDIKQELMEKAADLDVIEKAVDMAANQRPLWEIGDVPVGGNKFEEFILEG